MSSLLVKRNGNRWLSEDFYNIRAFHSPAQKRNGGGSMGSGDLSQCLPYLLSRGNEERLCATTTKPLARVWRRREVLPTGPLEMASHPHTGQEMPLEELLALYGYDLSNPLIQRDRGPSALAGTLPDITRNKDHITKDIFSREVDGEEEVQSLADDLTPSVASDNSDILQCHLRAHSLASGDKDISVSSSDDEDSDSASIPSNDSHKDIMVGPQYQAIIPPLGVFSCPDRAYESEDQLLWTPEVLSPSDVEKFLLLAQRRWGQGHTDAMAAHIVKDNEQALYELVKCNFNAEEALRRLHFNVKVFNEELCAWNEEECRNFEHGYRVHGKNFHLIQANKVRTRSVGECVEYYYLWKKSERHDFFMQQTTRLGRRRYNLQLGNIDDGEQDGDVAEMERSSSSNSHTSTGQSNTPSPSPDLEKQDAGCGLAMGELCASSCPCSPPPESVFSPYPPLPCLEDLREPPPPCSDSLSPPHLFPSSYSPSCSPFTCTPSSHSSPPPTPDTQPHDPTFYHLQLGSYLQDDLLPVLERSLDHGRMEVDLSMPPVLPRMPPTPGPLSLSPSASVTADFGSLGGFSLQPPLCPAPVHHPPSLTQ